ncbi:MAG: HAD family phosphatase [Micropruina sp.]
MKPVTAVIFDVANVIVDWDAGRALVGAVPDEQVRAFLASDTFWDINARTDAGMPLSEGLAEFKRTDADLAAVYRTYLERFPLTVTGPITGTAEVIEELLAAGVPCFGLSNWAAENFHIARAANPVLDRLADVIVSGEVGMAKPDPDIFRFALRRFGLDAATTVMIDDTQVNLVSAETVGLPTLHFTSAERLRRDLVGLGLL